VSIGGRDTGHVNRRLTIRGNGGAGVFLRPGGPEVAAHRNTIEDCVIEANCTGDGEAEIVLQGAAEGVRVTGNRIRRQPGRPGILIMPEMPAFECADNTIEPAGGNAIADRRAH
jgi:hypothetical protein